MIEDTEKLLNEVSTGALVDDPVDIGFSTGLPLRSSGAAGRSPRSPNQELGSAAPAARFAFMLTVDVPDTWNRIAGLVTGVKV